MMEIKESDCLFKVKMMEIERKDHIQHKFKKICRMLHNTSQRIKEQNNLPSPRFGIYYRWNGSCLQHHHLHSTDNGGKLYRQKKEENLRKR